MEFNDSVQEIETRLLPNLPAFAKEISQEFPKMTTRIYFGPGGDLAQYQSHSCLVDCVFPTHQPHHQSSILLIISVKQFTPSADAEIQASVLWVDDSLCEVEAELFPKRVKCTEDVLQELEKGLPQLYTTLKAAVRKGLSQNANKVL